MNDNGNAAAAGISLLFVFVGIIVYLVLILGSYALYCWMLARIFRKAGVEQWKAWVPIYNVWVLLEMGGQPGWWAILTLVPGANIAALVFSCIAIYHLGAGFGKPGAGWLLLYLFLPIVWLIILAFDDSRWAPGRMEVAPRYGPNIPYPGAGQGPVPRAAG
jgi:hypothetical protein